MNAPAIAQPAPSLPKLIAPLWHTALFLLTLGGIAAWGAYRQGLAAFGIVFGIVTDNPLFVYDWLGMGCCLLWLPGDTAGRWLDSKRYRRKLVYSEAILA